MLYSLSTDQLEPRPIPGTELASQPTFSPDGQWLAFEDPGVEKKVRLNGSAPIRISEGGGNNGADWTTRDELIVGATGKAHGLSKVGIGGGEPFMFTNVDVAKGERDHLWPIATPDGKAVVFVQWYGALATARLAIASLADGKVVPLNVKGIRPLAIIDHTLIFLKSDGAVMAVGLDEKGKRVTSAESSVLDPVSVNIAANGNSGIFVSPGGALVTTLGQRRSQLAWLSRDGSVTAIAPEVRNFYSPRLSPDGRKIAVRVTGDGGKTDIWIYDLGTATLSRLTSLETVGTFDWTPDGGQVVFTSSAVNSRTAFWSQSVEGGTPPIKLGEHDELSIAAALAPDGKSMLTSALHNNTWALLRMPIDPPGKAAVYVDSKGTAWGPRFSPDGRWVVFSSDESGRGEVYIRSYPDSSARIQVSDVGGGSPVWSRDGTRLLYHSGDVLVAARLAKDPALHIVSRDTLFHGIEQYDPSGSPLANFDLPADWSKVLVLKSTGNTFQIVAVPNWIVELRQRLAESGKKK